jgi:hypothetical protein
VSPDSRLIGARVVDLRSLEQIAGGIVVGSFIVEPGEIPLLPGSGRIVTLGAEPPEGGLRARLEDLLASGYRIREPAWKAPMPAGHRVVFEGAPARVQDVRWEDDQFRYDVLVLRGEGLVRVEGLVEEQLESVGPRGAAGLGAMRLV